MPSCGTHGNGDRFSAKQAEQLCSDEGKCGNSCFMILRTLPVWFTIVSLDTGRLALALNF